MKIVKFQNGKYGVRKWTLFGYEYKDLSNLNNYWWGKGCRYFIHSCQSDFTTAYEYYSKYHEKPVNLKKMQINSKQLKELLWK